MGQLERIYVPNAVRRASDPSWTEFGEPYVRIEVLNRTAQPDGDWLRLEETYAARGMRRTQRLPDAQLASKALVTFAVHYVVQSTSEMFEIVCFDHGTKVRHLAYAERRWVDRSGRPLPFEHASLSAWLERRWIQPSLHADDVLASFLGRDAPPDAPHRSSDQQAFTIYLPERVATEIDALAAAHGTGPGTIAWCAWEAAKPTSYERWKKAPGPAPRPPPSPALLSEPAERPWAVLGTERTRVSLELPRRVIAEIESVSERLDVGVATVFVAAYELGRRRLG